ncbi:hypothetical protein QSH39_014685 [Xanthomonas arboricola pv. corylina]|uniref:hypothetical protein n=1 Tax=Xanthomonas arboricola TaxID=56448 RepID=UPI002019250D|nr:hypothetical protein [Xanthomonas arboricola]MDN0202781.1 hypothetical protein [Xanthomonas arboricola pv. corylina]MDN0209898.1 hypothetical protein [Xanthomonas arboricola pv. corylina]MDN0214220.1 hypothetical protein [Xanthomonas arboricola pv. corylina]MDN0215334.1 hypothetical protein [Xanthomonas arboricola pv. corylina]UQQ08904.1 hypothetical protein KP021_11575 [Xanthomonas arboricola pv. corylina]
MAAVAAHGRFFRRRKVTIRAFGSPNTPLSVAAATKPGKKNRSRRLRPDFMPKSNSRSQYTMHTCAHRRNTLVFRPQAYFNVLKGPT